MQSLLLMWGPGQEMRLERGHGAVRGVALERERREYGDEERAARANAEHPEDVAFGYNL